MNSNRIKTFLIILLVIVNIFLLVNLLMASREKSSISHELLEASSKALSQKEIYIDSNKIPARKYTQSVISADCSKQARMQAAENFLGKIVAEYSLPDGITYQSDEAFVTFFENGRFEYGLRDSTANLSEISTVPTTETQNVGSASAKKVKDVFKKLTSHRSSDKVSYELVGQLDTNVGIIVYCRMEVDGLSVYGGDFVMIFNNDKLNYLSGKMFFDSFSGKYDMEYIDAPNALFLLDEREVIVDDIRMVYYPVQTAENEYFLIPSWQIIGDDEKVRIFDGVSGYERQ